MTITAQDTITPRRPSTGYLYSFTFACVALGFIGVALETGFAPKPTDGPSFFSGAGTAGLLLAFAILFAVRLVFWSRIPVATQALVRTAITGIFALSLAVSMILLLICVIGINGLPVPIAMVVFTALATLCQISAVIWLIRYRSE